MLVALGERLEKVAKIDEAKSLYWKAHLLALEKQTAHDSLALFKLGKVRRASLVVSNTSILTQLSYSVSKTMLIEVTTILQASL